MSECHNCSTMIDDNAAPDCNRCDRQFCDECHNSNVKQCDGCTGCYCGGCADDEFVPCGICEDVFCESCADDEFTRCDGCSSERHCRRCEKNHLTVVGYNEYCGDCLPGAREIQKEKEDNKEKLVANRETQSEKEEE